MNFIKKQTSETKYATCVEWCMNGWKTTKNGLFGNAQFKVLQ